MKKLLLVTSSALIMLTTDASDRLEVSLARPLPDYATSMLLSWTSAGQNRATWGGNFAVADLNGDGRLDIVQTEGPIPRPASDALDLGIFLQSATGALEKQALVHVGSTVTLKVLIADFNEDAKPDILIDEVDNDLTLALGRGDGTFADARLLGLGIGYYPAIGDLNGDKHVDIVGGRSGDGAVVVCLGRGDGQFDLTTELSAAIAPINQNPDIGGGHGAGAIVIGEVNGDENPDLLIASPTNATTKAGVLLVFFGTGGGNFSDPVRTSNVAAWRGAGADLNADGVTDYAGDLLNSGKLEVWLGSATGRFSRSNTHSLSDTDPVIVNIADLNDDGIPDIQVASEPINGCCEAPLSIFLGKGDGTFQARQKYSGLNGMLPLNVAPVVTDFDRNGLADLLTRVHGPTDAGILVGTVYGPKNSTEAGFELDIATDASGPLIVESTDDFTTWTALATNGRPRAVWSVIDSSMHGSKRFYRTRRP